MSKREEIKRLIEKERQKLLSKEHVVGLGLGYKVKDGKTLRKLSLVVLVDKKVPISSLEVKDRIPKQIEGIITDVIETGEFKALTNRRIKKKVSILIPLETVNRKTIVRPAKGGVSIGHQGVTAGTLGFTFHDKDGQLLIMSNNHVLANENVAKIGDKIYQPGMFDITENQLSLDEALIGYLYKFYPVAFLKGNCPISEFITRILNRIAKLIKSRYHWQLKKVDPVNLIDAALAKPLGEDVISPLILDIGIPEGYGKAKINDEVEKSGRTTGYTEGRVVLESVTSTVKYRRGLAVFVDQLLIRMNCAGGDSGSAIVRKKDKKIVGLLFAGGAGYTLANRIENINDLLGLGLEIK